MTEKWWKHPTIEGAEASENDFSYSKLGREFTGHYREVWKEFGDRRGSISVQARSHIQQLHVYVSELPPEHADEVAPLVNDQKEWLLKHPPEHLLPGAYDVRIKS